MGEDILGDITDYKRRVGDRYVIDSSWKEDSDRLFGSDDALVVWKNMERFLPSEDKNLTVLGVSENVPTHMAAIFRK